MNPDQILAGYLIAAAVFSVGLGYAHYTPAETPAEIPYYKVDGSEMQWMEK